MSFEFDPDKSLVNKVKHRIDFVEEAQALWLDSAALLAPATSKTEERYLFVGKIGTVLWTAVVTFRGPNLRLISVRRARTEEKKAYESQ